MTRSENFVNYMAYKLFHESHQKRVYIRFIVICLLLLIIYSFFHKDKPKYVPNISIEFKTNRTKYKTYIVTENCDSERYRVTKNNIEIALPNFLDISCYPFIPLNDSRIHHNPLPLLKKFSSNLITFINLWTYQIPADLKDDEDEWAFIFEDDVNFVNSTTCFQKNFIETMNVFLNNPEIRKKHGFLYLGICGPIWDNVDPIISENTEKNLTSQIGCGFCLHAAAITPRRSRFFWTEVSSYRPNDDGSLDKMVQSYCVRSGNHFYTFGSSFHYPMNTGRYGIAFQDRGRFGSTVV